MQNAGPTFLTFYIQVVDPAMESKWNMADGYPAAVKKSLEL